MTDTSNTLLHVPPRAGTNRGRKKTPQPGSGRSVSIRRSARHPLCRPLHPISGSTGLSFHGRGKPPPERIV